MNKVELSSIYGTMVSTMLASLQATLDAVLKEYTEASLSVLEGALNSDMTQDEALSKLKETYTTYNGKYDGCVCMFKHLIGDKLIKIMETDLYITFDRFMIDLNITYSKHIYRLNELKRNGGTDND